MHKLTVLPLSPMVDALMQRLEEASIEAACVPERTAAELYVGGAGMVSVWVLRGGDLDRAIRILQDLQVERTVSRCPRCGYDLHGHAGPTRCPECGHGLRAGTTDVECPQCGEPVPADFEVCWSCGADLSPPDA